MFVQVLLNLLNELGKEKKMRDLPSILSLLFFLLNSTEHEILTAYKKIKS